MSGPAFSFFVSSQVTARKREALLRSVDNLTF